MRWLNLLTSKPPPGKHWCNPDGRWVALGDMSNEALLTALETLEQNPNKAFMFQVLSGVSGQDFLKELTRRCVVLA